MNTVIPVVIPHKCGYTHISSWLYQMNVVIPIQHGGYTIRSWLYIKSSWLYPNIVVVITKLLCQIEFYQWLAQYDTDRCVSCFLFLLKLYTFI